VCWTLSHKITYFILIRCNWHVLYYIIRNHCLFLLKLTLLFSQQPYVNRYKRLKCITYIYPRTIYCLVKCKCFYFKKCLIKSYLNKYCLICHHVKHLTNVLAVRHVISSVKKLCPRKSWRRHILYSVHFGALVIPAHMSSCP
jgi:hypothetical protein